MRKTLLTSCVLFVGIGVLMACSDDSSSVAPPVGTDGGQQEAGSSSGSSGSSSGSSGSTDSGGSDASDSSTKECNDLTQQGDEISPTITSDPAPAGAGGTLVDGTYTETAVILHGTPVTDAGALTAAKARGTLVLSGTTAQTVMTDADGNVTHETNTYAVSGTSITGTTTCTDNPSGPGSPKTQPFTATATDFRLIIDGGTNVLFPAGLTYEIVFTKK